MKKRFLFLAKIGISLLILAIIFSKIDFSQVIVSAKKIPFYVFGILAVLSFFRHFTQYINWKRFLRLSSNYKHQENSELKSYLIGLALRFTLPGGHGTFGKVLFIEGHKKSSLLSVFYEKFTVTFFNYFVGNICFYFLFSNVSVVYRVLAVLSSIVVLFFGYYFGKKKYSSISLYFKQLVFIAPVQLTYILLNVIQYWVCLQSLKNTAFLKVLISVPPINLANIIPVTINGLGLRETIAIKVFEQSFVTGAQIVSVTLILFIINDVLPAFLGVKYILKHGKEK